MKERNEMVAALEKFEKRRQPPVVEAQAVVPEEKKPKQPVPDCRKGKTVISGFFDPAVGKQLRYIVWEEETTVQALLNEALNDLFEKRGKARIA